MRVIFDTGRIGNTPLFDDDPDTPWVRDPRAIHRLNAEQRAAIEKVISVGGYMAIAGFERWRGSDYSFYVDVLGFGRTADDADTVGMGVGPITSKDLDSFRMAIPVEGKPNPNNLSPQLVFKTAPPSGQSVVD